MPTPEQIERLPRWAQQHIEMLTRNVEHWKAKATAGPENSDTFVQNFEGVPAMGANQPLGQSPTVLFRLASGDVIEARLDRDGAFVSIAAGSHGALVSQPQASNVLRVRTERWWT